MPDTLAFYSRRAAPLPSLIPHRAFVRGRKKTILCFSSNPHDLVILSGFRSILIFRLGFSSKKRVTDVYVFSGSGYENHLSSIRQYLVSTYLRSTFLFDRFHLQDSHRGVRRSKEKRLSDFKIHSISRNFMRFV